MPVPSSPCSSRSSASSEPSWPPMPVMSARRPAIRRDDSDVRVIILGGTGFVGPHVVRELDRAGHDVTLYHSGRTEPDLPSTVRHVHGRFEELDEHVDGLRALEPDVVLDMIPYVREDVARLRLFAGHAGRAVAVSSMDVYRAFGRAVGTEPGEPEPLPLTEDSPLRSVVIDEKY